MVDYDETAELADLRKLLRSGPRTNRARPTELVDAPAAAPPADDVMRKASRLSELLKTHEGLDEAEPLMRQELTQRESTYGFGSEHTLVSATCLAMCLQAKGVVDEALRLYNRVVEGYEALPQFGPDHTDTLNAVNNLAVFLKSLGSYEKALPLYERVLAGDEAVHGADHPHTLDSVFNLARLCTRADEPTRGDPSPRPTCASPASPGLTVGALLLPVRTHAYACACACACAHVRVRMCVHMCVHMRVRACVLQTTRRASARRPFPSTSASWPVARSTTARSTPRPRLPPTILPSSSSTRWATRPRPRAYVKTMGWRPSRALAREARRPPRQLVVGVRGLAGLAGLAGRSVSARADLDPWTHGAARVSARRHGVRGGAFAPRH